mmetsp:Transcript_28468/g.67845  ORF Transcript_28468/g.67845 Transcript_28468/m.67845 type:complete len:294 (-) Transcript_28468:795-1676(-)
MVSCSCRTAGWSSCAERSRVTTAVDGSERSRASREARSEYSSSDRRSVLPAFASVPSASAALLFSPLVPMPGASLFPPASRPVRTWSGPSASRDKAGSIAAPRPVYGDTTPRWSSFDDWPPLDFFLRPLLDWPFLPPGGCCEPLVDLPFAGTSFDTNPSLVPPSIPSTARRYRVTCAKPTMSDRAARRDAAGSSGRSAGRGRASVGAAGTPPELLEGLWRGERRVRPVISTWVTVWTFRGSFPPPSAVGSASGSSASFGSSTCISSFFSVMIDPTAITLDDLSFRRQLSYLSY